MNDTIDEALKALLPPFMRDRVLSLRHVPGHDTNGGAAVSLVLDGTGLDGEAREHWENSARQALAEPRRPQADTLQIPTIRIAIMADRPAASQQAPGRQAAPRIIAVGSGKGGVGKSTLTANLAVALHRMGRKVGVVDADIYGPSQPRLLANEGIRPQARDKRLVPVPSPHGPAVLSMGHLTEEGQAIAWRGPMASGALSQLIEAEWGDVEYLIVDLPPGTGDVQLTMLQRFRPAGAVIVSTPQDLALMDAKRAMHLFAAAPRPPQADINPRPPQADTNGVPVIGLIENMAGYVCPHCGEISDPFGHGGVEATARELGYDFLGRVPLTLAIRRESDAGQPPAASDTIEGRAFAAIARRIADWLDHRRP